MPNTLQATNGRTLQMVWGPGTFGYDPVALYVFAQEQCPLLNVSQIMFDNNNHGQAGGDNFGEGSLDVSMIASFGLNVKTIVSNTNTSASTEEGNGFGQALLDFLVDLAARPIVPHVLSISLGSLSAASCDLLCAQALQAGISLDQCQAYLQNQRQVCMFLSQAQVARIDAAFQILGMRGITVFGSSGDGGSHFSFQPFSSDDPNTDAIFNNISCTLNLPTYLSDSPYVVSVGGEDWASPTDPPVAWVGSGGGFAWEFARPAFQNDVVVAYLAAQSNTSGFPAMSAFNASGRAYPDVAAFAEDGTSQSSPIFAGLFSMVMDQRLNAGLPPLGFLAPRIYLVGQQYPGEAFQDITSGDTSGSAMGPQTCNTGFPATAGWDAVTGWGRPVWGGLVKHFAADDTLPAKK
jgi:hypothetical protein